MRANYPENYTNLGEIRFFSKYAWGDSNFMCGITQGGCSTVPTAKSIIERLLLYRKGEDHTLAANLAEARRIFFMAKEIQAITELFVYQWVGNAVRPWNHLSHFSDKGQHIFDKVQQNAMDMIDNLVAEFTQQVEIESDQICSSKCFSSRWAYSEWGKDSESAIRAHGPLNFLCHQSCHLNQINSNLNRSQL